MLTIDALKACGADTESGLARCLGNEDFYLKLVGKALSDDGFERLQEAVSAGDLDAAFERAHALKGVVGNLSLTNLMTPISEITEDLRARRDLDYSGIMEKITAEISALRALIE